MNYPVKGVSFGHMEKGKLVRFSVTPRGRQMLLQRFRDGLPPISDIVLCWQPKGHQPVAITPEDVEWGDITPSSTWKLPGEESDEHRPELHH